LFGAQAEEGAKLEFQLVRESARILEVDHFASGGAVVLPAALPSLAATFHHLAGGADRVFFTGHGDSGKARARNVQLLLQGPRQAWADDSAASLNDDEKAAIRAFAAGHPGGTLVADESTALDAAALVQLFDLYDAVLRELLGTDDLA